MDENSSKSLVDPAKRVRQTLQVTYIVPVIYAVTAYGSVEMRLFKPNVRKMKAKGDVEGLIKVLKNKDPNLRGEAALALAELKDARAMCPLIQAMKDEDLCVCRSAWVAFGEIKDKGTKDARAVESLIQALENEDWWIRRGVAEILGRIGDARAVEPLILTLKDEDSDVRESAACALGKIKDARATEPLVKALKHAYWWVRKAAAEALGEIGDARAAEPLTQALKDKDSVVRETAAEALEKIRAKEN
jgi:HEAT repeat protein